MTRIHYPLCLFACVLLASCGRSPSPEPPPQGPSPPADQVPTEAPPTAENERPAAVQAEPPPAEPDQPPLPPLPAYTDEQIAAGRQLAADLNVVIREDADGNVVLLDTAARRSWVDDYQMQEMLVFPHLESLTVEGPSISDELVPRIAQQTRLTTLVMRNTLISDSGVAQLAELPNLRIIDLRVSPLITEAAMETLAGMPELRAVRLSSVNVTDRGVATLLKLPRLSELDVRNCRGVTRAGIEQLRDKPTLRVLKIGGPAIDDQVLAVVGGMKNLTGLSLDNCSITNAGVAELDGLPLVELTIYQCPNVTDDGLQVLRSYDQLKRLTLRDVAAEGKALAHLPNPQQLVSLNMAQSRITDDHLEPLAAMSSLESLNLSETALTDAAIEPLAQLKSLKQLVLTQTRITEQGGQQLRQALPNCQIQLN